MTLRNAFDSLALESTLKSLHDGNGSSPLTRKVLNGDVYIVGKAITLTGVLDSTRKPTLQVSNPATSTKVLLLIGLNIYSNVNQQIHYSEDATMAGTVNALTPMNANRATTKTSVALGSWSSTAPTSGTLWPNESRVVNELLLDLPPVVLPPNKSFTIIGQSSAEQIFTANAYFIEAPAA